MPVPLRLGFLAKDNAADAHADPLVQGLVETFDMAHAKVAAPPQQQGVKAVNHSLQRLATVARGEFPHLVLEFLQRFLPWLEVQAPIGPLHVPSQKLEALPYVDDPGLRGVHGEVQLTLEDLHKQTL